nr:PREDICTED: bursicon isoform X1 [Linepithema humile]
MYRPRSKFFCYLVINGFLICLLSESVQAIVGVDECQATRVIHFLEYPGCVPKPIPSYACRGRCSSYLQVSGSKMWQMERSCMCCQESGEREASVSLFCPRAKPGEKKFRKVRLLTFVFAVARRSAVKITRCKCFASNTLFFHRPLAQSTTAKPPPPRVSHGHIVFVCDRPRTNQKSVNVREK